VSVWNILVASKYCRNVSSGRPIAEDNRERERCLRLFQFALRKEVTVVGEKTKQNRDETKKETRQDERNQPGEGRVPSRGLSLESRSKIRMASNDAISRSRWEMCQGQSRMSIFISKVVQRRLLRGCRLKALGVLQTPWAPLWFLCRRN